MQRGEDEGVLCPAGGPAEPRVPHLSKGYQNLCPHSTSESVSVGRIATFITPSMEPA